MIRNYILVAVRSILKQRIYSLINVLGLSIALASCIMIFLYVENESSYDKFHDKSAEVYKLFLERLYPDHVTHYAVTPHSFADVMVSDIPEVVQSVKMIGNNGNPVQVTYIDEREERISFEENQFILADSNFFDMFSIRLMVGDEQTALTAPQSIVLTESTAQRYFGDSDPIGKSITSDFGEFKVTGICEDVPENSHFDFDFLGSLSSVPFFQQNQNFVGFTAHIYVELTSGSDAQAVQEKIPELVEKYAAPQIEQNLNTTFQDYIAAGNGYNYLLINIEDIHLEPQNYEFSFKAGGDRNDVFVFISIAVLILIIACINFMNLAIARSTERGKEVGIRKTLGSERSQLVAQFLTESIIISLFSLLVSIAVVYLTLPSFNSIVQKNLELNLDSMVLPMLVVFSVVVGLLAGSYPAFILSSFKPVVVLKGVMKKGNSASWLRNGMVILQFTISIILILSTLVIKDQMDYIRNKDLGFDREQIMVVKRTGVLAENYESFVNEVRKIPGVVNASGSNAVLAGQYFGIQFQPAGGSEVITTNGIVVNDDFVETMSLEVIEGRSFSEDRNDSLSVIINEETVKLLGDGPILGTKLETQLGNPPRLVQLEVVGIVKNFHYMSLRDEISPFVLMNNEVNVQNNPNFTSIKLSGDYKDIIAQIDGLWKERVPEEPFKYTFLDSELDELYQNEANTGKRITIFSALAIIIACIGLFGLSAYTAGLRTKEIGVRKVMGASTGKVVMLLSTDFTKLVLISFVIAIPLGWYSMDRWLNNFVYHTDINLLNIFWAGFITLAIAWITVSFQSFKAAVVNPVKSLRSE